MPDQRTHRGPHPEDAELFAPVAWPHLRDATHDLSWLLTHGYATPSALKLVGDRYSLNQRQRVAVMRSACSDKALQSRLSRRLRPELLRGRPLLIDGYNVLTTLEAALGGGVILAARDTCYRDMASIHGTYRKVEETLPAIALAGKVLAELGPSSCQWYLDSPVGNSGRLKGVLLEEAAAKGWNWQVDVVIDPDAILSRTEHTVATADSVILDRCQHWFNLASHVIQQTLPSVTVVQMTTKGERQDAEAAWRSY